MNNEGALKRIIRLVAGALVGTGAGLLSVGGAAAIAPTVAQVCEGLPGYIVLPPPAKAGGVVVCQYDPGWSEAAWWASSKDGVGPVRLTGGIVIVEGVEFYVCSGQELRIEVRDTTHMGTRTRTLWRVGLGEERLAIIFEWQHYGRGYVPAGGIDGCSGEAK